MVLDIGMIPLPNDLPENTHESVKVFSSRLVEGEFGELVLQSPVPMNEVFGQSYPYRSGLSMRKPMIEMIEDLGLDLRGKKVLDIGGNDGTLLDICLERGAKRVVLWDPSAPREVEHETIREFFQGGNLVDSFTEYFDVVFAVNVLAHVDDAVEFLDSARTVLDPEGVFVQSSTTLRRSDGALQWDTIYHEHQRYYDEVSMRRLLTARGLSPSKVVRSRMHGGSVQSSSSPGSAQFEMIVPPQAEDLQWEFVKSVARLRGVLDVWTHEGRFPVVAFGAPSRSSTLAFTARLQDYVLATFEQSNSLKVGKYLPGTSILITAEPGDLSHVRQAILFSSHLGDVILPRLREKGFAGELLDPLTGRVIS